MGSLRDRNQAFHQNLNHAGQQEHNCREVHAGTKYFYENGGQIAGIVEAEDAKDQADDQTKDYRLAPHAEALADGLWVRIEVRADWECDPRSSW